jgi:probable phosphoglycerate mutase
MRSLILIRHGRTAWNAERRLQGTRDVPLDDVGREQARRLAERVRGEHVDALYSSPLIRARATADTLAAALGRPVLPEPAWREIDVGDLEGLSAVEAEALRPGWWDAMKSRRFHAPGGESPEQVIARVTASFERLAARHPGERVAVVSHGFALHMFCAWLFGLPEDDPVAMRPHTNTAVTEIEDPRGARRIVVASDTSHLQ